MDTRFMSRAILPVAALAALAACGSGNQMKAGQWEMTYSVADISMPGAPPQMIEELKKQKETKTSCLTEEEARNPMAKMVQQGQNESCSTENMKMEGGRISGSMTCRAPGGPGEMKGEVSGEYGAETIAMNIEADMANPANANEKIEMTMRLEGRRTGECSGNGAKS